MKELLDRRNTKQITTTLVDENIEQLTTSEKKIIKMLSVMKTSHDIADELSISIKTVQNHRNNICVKLGLTGTHSLLKFAIENAERIQ